MKYKYKKNSNKKIITKEKHEINDNINKNKSANINRIKNEPIIKIINKDELIDDIIGAKKIGIDKKEIKTKKSNFKINENKESQNE